MAGIFFFFCCAICEDEAHPNPPPSWSYTHTREYARWKGDRVPPGGWKKYDHKPKVDKR